jgi:hypothetical protein
MLPALFGTGTTLAETKLTFQGGNWTQLNFTVTPTAGTTCRGFPADTPPLWCKLGANSNKGDAAHACVQCSGQLAIYLETADATVDLDYAFFQPGSWGRYKELPVNLESVEWLQRTNESEMADPFPYLELWLLCLCRDSKCNE